MDELQLLVSEGNSLVVQVGSDEISSMEGGGGGGGGGGRGGGGRGRAVGGAGRHGWKPLHLGSPFMSRAEGSDAFRVSNLSNDFVLQRFFYRQNKREKRKIINMTFKESQDTFNIVKSY